VIRGVKGHRDDPLRIERDDSTSESGFRAAA